MRWRVLTPFLLAAGCAADPEPAQTGDRLEVPMPGVSADGFTIYEIEELQNDPRAGDPAYVYLDYLEDAVRMPGPSFALADEDRHSIFVAGEITVESYLWGDEAWEDGLRITVNDRLHFDMKIEDFEEEVSPLAQVDMTLDDGVVDTSFIMLGNGHDGVAHAIVTTVVIDGTPGASSGPYTLEMRGTEGSP